MPLKRASEEFQFFTQKLVLVSRGKTGAKDLSQEDAKRALDFLFSCESDPVQVAAFLTAFRFKGATSQELSGFCEAIKGNSLTIHPEVENLLDCSGPYDGRSKTLSLEVAHALVAAAAGVPVILHSTNELKPKLGITSADILEVLGIPAYLEPALVEKRIEKNNFGFLHASRFAYGLEKLRNVRELLSFRTVLNTCETLNNPASAKNMLFGVAHEHFQQKMVEVVRDQGAEHVLAVSGLEGSDELPLKPVKAVELKNGEIKSLELNPEDFGLSQKEKLSARNAEETAQVVYDSLTGKTDEHNASIVYNAGIRIYLGNRAETIDEGIKQAENILESGRASAYFGKLVSL